MTHEGAQLPRRIKHKMQRNYLEQWSLGLSVSEIVERANEDAAYPTTPEQVSNMIQQERLRIAEKAVLAILKRAEAGDVAAVEWLERKYVLTFEAADVVQLMESSGAV